MKHCGRVESIPLLTLFLPTRDISGSSENFVKIGTWDAVDYEEV